MFVLLALTSVAVDRAPDAVELALKDKCGVEVPRDANMSYAGDLWRVLYDERLSPKKVKCIEDWAKAWPKVGAILAYRRSQFVIPESLRRR